MTDDENRLMAVDIGEAEMDDLVVQKKASGCTTRESLAARTKVPMVLSRISLTPESIFKSASG